MKNYLLFFFFINLFSYSAIGQETIQGVIKDIETGEVLPAATILVNDSIVLNSDETGRFQITLPDIRRVNISYVGYEDYTKRIFMREDDTTNLKVFLVPIASLLNTLVVTSTNYEKNISLEPTSIEIIQPLYIQNNNITKLDELIQRVPGIQVQDGQASIRSSGFAQGAGSRVGFIVDGMPMLGGDNSSIQWNFMPIENIDQIEVIKGAASVLYGSAAMNGVINVRTAFPTSEPRTSITLYSGITDGPKETYRQWWDWDTAPEEAPKNYGIFVSHRQKFGNLDLVFGGNAHQSIGQIQGEDEQRLRANLKARYRFTDKFNVTLETYLMDYSLPPYVSWLDGDTSVLIPQDTLRPDSYQNASVALTAVYNGENDFKHTLRGRIFNNTFISAQTGIRYPVTMLFGEYQVQKSIGDFLVFTGGVAHQQFSAINLNFGEDTLSGDTRDFGAGITSFYGQTDANFFDNRLNVVLGLRWESIDAGIEDYESIPPILRVSSTFQLTPKDVLRASFGQGYRFPSLLERYADITISTTSLEPLSSQVLDFGINPNPDLRPEYGWSAELGYRKSVKKNGWDGYLDVALFTIRYRDMIFLTLDYHDDSDEPFFLQKLIEDPEPFGFQNINFESTLIAGFEIGANMGGKIGKLPFKVWTGYTYTYPGNLDFIEQQGIDTDIQNLLDAIITESTGVRNPINSLITTNNYVQNLSDAFIIDYDAGDSTVVQTMLPNRSTHVFRADLEFYIKNLTLGGAIIMNGFFHRVDPLIEGSDFWSAFVEQLNGQSILPGTREFRDANRGNNWIFDLRAGYKINQNMQINFIVNNVLNRTYAVRTGRIDPLRTFNLKYSFVF